MPESYLNKRNTVPYACRNGAYPDPERNTTIIKQKSLVIKQVNTLPKLISSRHHPCVREKNIYVSQKVILFNCLQHIFIGIKNCALKTKDGSELFLSFYSKMQIGNS
jgi:hypothetical protein